MKSFISYSTQDKPFVSRLATDLRTRHGIDAWLDQWEINPGDMIPEKIEQGLSEAEVLILVLSPDSVDSRWVDYERQAWLTMQIKEESRGRKESRSPALRLIPVLYRDCSKPAFLQPIHHVEITDRNFEDGIKLLASAIRGDTERPCLSKETATVPQKGVPPRLYAMSLLKRLMPPQFEEVVFIYNISHAYLPAAATQVQKAIALIEYAVQREGADVSNLLKTIFQVVPHFGDHR